MRRISPISSIFSLYLSLAGSGPTKKLTHLNSSPSPSPSPFSHPREILPQSGDFFFFYFLSLSLFFCVSPYIHHTTHITRTTYLTYKYIHTVPISRAFGYPVPTLHMYSTHLNQNQNQKFFLTRWRATVACMHMQVCLCVFSAGRFMQDVSLGIICRRET